MSEKESKTKGKEAKGKEPTGLGGKEKASKEPTGLGGKMEVIAMGTPELLKRGCVDCGGR